MECNSLGFQQILCMLVYVSTAASRRRMPRYSLSTTFMLRASVCLYAM